jgi:DNA mismatch endonuclease (patch repair protein)
MTDIFSKELRTKVMKAVRSRGNQTTELKLISLFNANHITGWSRNYPVKGHPDFAFKNRRIAVFVDGCFWHAHDCRNIRPKANERFWEDKRNKNIEHDKAITHVFLERRWKVLRIWECELNKDNLPRTLSRIRAVIGGKTTEV